MKQSFSLEQSDIDNAIHGSGKYCPIANCLTRNGFENVHVSDYALLDDKQNNMWGFLDAEARRIVRAWDNSGKGNLRAGDSFSIEFE